MSKRTHILSSKGMWFPTSNELLEARNKLRPVITPVLDNKGVRLHKDLVAMTGESIVNVIPSEHKFAMLQPGYLERTFKDY